MEKKVQKKRVKKMAVIPKVTVDPKVCMVCGGREEDDSDVEQWVTCDTCSKWVHAKCIQPTHPYSIFDTDFYCQSCFQS